jgi:hypothetical protein
MKRKNPKALLSEISPRSLIWNALRCSLPTGVFLHSLGAGPRCTGRLKVAALAEVVGQSRNHIYTGCLNPLSLAQFLRLSLITPR